MEKCLLEDILSRIGDIEHFEDITIYISQFSDNKTLYNYQKEAIYNCLRLLYIYYHDYQSGGENVSKSKEYLIKVYDEIQPKFSWENRLRKYTNDRKQILNDKFVYFILNGYFEQSFGNGEEYVEAKNFYNRCAFWMATAAGKSIVIIKLIDILKKLMDRKLIPEKPILLLTPKEYIIEQIMKEADEFNNYPYNENEIEFVSLKDFGSYTKSISSGSVDVFYYRSDLIRDKPTENFISHYDIDNDGNWYVILDEAHRGDNDYSLAKGYFTALTRNGFLFNFSATFADAIDFQTTLYNFNLEKFIEHKYGKNIFLSKSLYTFKNHESELDEFEKQKEVIKSFIVYSAIKRSRIDNKLYHSPLLMTLVGTVNTNNSDLKVYFRIIELLVTGKIEKELYFEAKQELLENEFPGDRIRYSLGNEELLITDQIYSGKSFFDLLKETEIATILLDLFNSSTFGKIEFIHSEDVQEIGMKLETSDKIFGLLKIGERDRFEKSIMSDENNYSITKSISIKSIFERIESDPDINMLCGSRVFYEGWDTNRPNVINLIDIGSKDAPKFVPQAIGRGIRIKPTLDSRKRLNYDDNRKNQLLETLFVFATNRDVIDTIVEIKGSRHNEEKEYEVSLKKNDNIAFELIIPKFRDSKGKARDLAKYNLSRETYQNFRNFFLTYPYELLFIKYGLQYIDYCFIKENLPENIDKSKLFALAEYDYYDMPWLLRRIITHIQGGQKTVDSLVKIDEETIRHFKRIRLYYDDPEQKKSLIDKIERMSEAFQTISADELWPMYDKGEISRQELQQSLMEANQEKREEQDDIVMLPLVNHYYLPLMYSKIEENKHIGSIIKVASEREFIKNLVNKIPRLKSRWYFSKVLENVDNIFIPYFSKRENRWRKFYADFIFWVKRENRYDIYFVDPKGTKLTDYQQKIDYYKKFFYDEEKDEPVIFTMEENKHVRFWLRLITDNINNIPESNPYSKFWFSNTDFSFLE